MSCSLFEKHPKVCESVLCLLDSFLSLVIFAPIVVGYWRGCWQVMDTFLFPENKIHSLFSSMAIGIGSGLIFGYFQNILEDKSNSLGKYSFLLLSRTYTIIFCFCCVNHWRGVWMAWDVFSGSSWQSGLTSTLLGIIILTLTRGVKNILAPPYVLIPDYREHYFVIHTQYNTKRERHKFFILDLFFTVVFTQSLVVFVWRGTWIILDRLLYPENAEYSAWGSLIIGASASVITFFLQILLPFCLQNLKKGFLKVITEDAYHILCFIGAVSLWRGVWNSLNIYLLPGHVVLSNFITMIGGNILLILLYCANSTIPIRGAGMDGDHPGKEGVIFQTNYLRSFFNPHTADLRRRSSCRFEIHPPLPHCSEDQKINGQLDLRNPGSSSVSPTSEITDDYQLDGQSV